MVKLDSKRENIGETEVQKKLLIKKSVWWKMGETRPHTQHYTPHPPPNNYLNII